jgi:hypothetical protein
LFVWDYKNGHRIVKAENNLQLIDYVAGLSRELGFDGMDELHVNVVMRIVMPFCYQAKGPIDEWVGKLADLRGQFNLLHTQAHQAMTNPTLTSGFHCRDCLAVRDCSAARRAAYNLIDVVNVPYEMDAMTSRDMGVELRNLKDGAALLKARIEALEDEITNRIQRGEGADTGYTIQSAEGRLKWVVPPAEAVALGSMFGIDISVPDVMTPTQAKKLVPKELAAAFDAAISTVAQRPAGALKLALLSDSVAYKAFKRK